MLTIGICGASGSGKSTLAKELADRLEQRCIYLKQDSYYKDHPDMSFEERERINYDEPDAFEHNALIADLNDLRAGKPILAKDYDYTMHRRCDSGTVIYPADVVLIEGIHVFYDPAVRELLDFKIYIQVDPDVCLLRRVKRDIRDRGREIDGIYKQYLDSVRPMYEKYIRNYVNYADLIGKEVEENDAVTGSSPTDPDSEKKQRISEYAEVLLRQSKKLKKLLDDLLEASKATTGNLEVHPEVCDVSVLLSQAAGEYEQRFSDKKLETIVKQPEETVKVMADGRHLWRVFDNLLNNIYKYAQAGSRVYLNVEHDGQDVRIIFRNMSAFPLEMSPEELEARFTRGDKSRHMEGNGLGLSIAKSLTELQNGDMQIVTDGDLFKVVITLPETE